MNNNPKSSSRIHALDSMRGLACLCVVVGHAVASVFIGHNIFELTPLYLMEAAHEAVIFFFILSGFVLVYHCSQSKKFNYTNFIVSRFCRIYLPYFAAILFAFLQFYYFNGKVAVDPRSWLNHWTQPLTYRTFWEHVLLIGNYDLGAFNPVVWSLIHEMRIALLFPLLLIVLRQNTVIALGIAGVFSITSAILLLFNLEISASYHSGFIYTIHYFSMFLIGGLVVKHREQLSAKLNALSHNKKAILLSSALLLYCYARMVALIPHKYNYLKISFFNEFLADWLVAISVVVIMTFCLNISKNEHVLQSRLPLFFGKISYSLYLVHVPIMLSTYNTFPNVPLGVVITTSVLISIAIAYFFNLFIEVPSAKIGKKLLSLLYIKN